MKVKNIAARNSIIIVGSHFVKIALHSDLAKTEVKTSHVGGKNARPIIDILIPASVHCVESIDNKIVIFPASAIARLVMANIKPIFATPLMLREIVRIASPTQRRTVNNGIIAKYLTIIRENQQNLFCLIVVTV